MPRYKNVAPRVIGIAISPVVEDEKVVREAQLVLVNPQAEIECTEAEAAGHLRKGALQALPDRALPDAAPPAASLPPPPPPPPPPSAKPAATKSHHRPLDKDDDE